MIKLTDRAAERLGEIIEDTAAQAYRVGVKGGGCAGLEYNMEFIKTSDITEHDRIFEYEGVKVVCDPKSYLYLNGLQLDFSDALMGGGFRFNNPNASRVCSCGTSFSV